MKKLVVGIVGAVAVALAFVWVKSKFVGDADDVVEDTTED